MNTCKLTINHHPDTDQCGEHMIHYAVHIEPINLDLPRWVTNAATSHMCADKATEHGHHMNMPYVAPVIEVMAEQGLDTVVVLAPDYWDIEAAFWVNGTSPIADRMQRIADRPEGVTALLIDLGAHMVGLTTRKQAWDAK